MNFDHTKYIEYRGYWIRREKYRGLGKYYYPLLEIFDAKGVLAHGETFSTGDSWESIYVQAELYINGMIRLAEKPREIKILEWFNK
jgi:hypothetical protein